MTITGVTFVKAKTVVGGVTGISTVSYIDPKTNLKGTIKVTGLTVAGHPQQCPTNASYCLTKSGGVGGQLLLNSKNAILDAKPKPSATQPSTQPSKTNPAVSNPAGTRWVTITGVTFAKAKTVVGGVTGISTVSFVDPKTNMKSTIKVTGLTVAGNPQQCPTNSSYCLMKSGGVGGQLLLSATNAILDSRPKPGTSQPSTYPKTNQPSGTKASVLFNQNTWVIITNIQFIPSPKVIVGVTGTSVVTYMNPATQKTGTLRVVGKTTAGNPQVCPDNESYCLTRAGGIGGQLLLSPTGQILDSKPKPSTSGPGTSGPGTPGPSTSTPWYGYSRAPYTQTTVIGTVESFSENQNDAGGIVDGHAMGLGPTPVSGVYTVTYSTQSGIQVATIPYQSSEPPGPTNFGNIVAQAGIRGTVLMDVDGNGNVLNVSVLSSTLVQSNQPVDPGTGQPQWDPNWNGGGGGGPGDWHGGEGGWHDGDGGGDGYGGDEGGDGGGDGDGGGGDGGGYGYGVGDDVVPVALITVPPTDAPVDTSVPDDTSGPSMDTSTAATDTTPTQPTQLTLAPDGIPAGKTIFWMSKKTFIIVLIMLCLASLLVCVGYYIYRKHKGGGPSGGGGPGGYGGNMGLGGGNMGLGGGELGR